MSVFDDARKGILVGARLNSWLRNDPDALDSQDPDTGWTLLATAVVAGFPDQVETLLGKGASATLRCRNGETPLLLATWKAPMERPLMVQKLLSRVPKSSVDDTCDLAENNTPLMWAIEKQDLDSIRLLVKAGARLDIENDDSLNAIVIAENTGKSSVVNALNPKKEQSQIGRTSSIVTTICLNVVSWVDRQFRGFMGRVFGFKGERHKAADEKLSQKMKAKKPEPEKPTAEDFVKAIDEYVKDSSVLSSFFINENKGFIQKMVQKTVDLANDSTTDLGSPECLHKTIQVSMHQQVIYCDDSSSMVSRKGFAESRWETQKALARRIARITTRILPEGEGVALRFINQEINESVSLDLEGIGQALNSALASGDTAIGTMLERRILEPLVYGPLKSGTVKRPLLVTILTDGGPSGEDEGKLAKAIVECGETLEKYGYPRDCVKFLVGQIGSSKEAVAFLNSLNHIRKNSPGVASVLEVYAGRLDDRFRSFRDERQMDRWLIETLFKPLAGSGREG